MVTPANAQHIARAVWELVRAQHGVITRRQLLSIGLTDEAIRHRLRTGRLFRLWPGVYAVGRPDVSRRGLWKASTLACGEGHALDGESGMALFGVRSAEGRQIEVAVPDARSHRLPGIRARRVRELADHLEEVDGIPVLSLPLLFVRLAPRLGESALEAAINEADKKDLIHVDALRAALGDHRGRPGVAKLRRTIDIATFRYTDSELERAMRPIFRRAGLRTSYLTQEWVNGYRVDFYFPQLNLVIETDGGRFHRTAFQQRKDRRRDQTHTINNTPHLRFTHGQIKFDRGWVEWAITKKARDLMASGERSPGP